MSNNFIDRNRYTKGMTGAEKIAKNDLLVAVWKANKVEDVMLFLLADLSLTYGSDFEEKYLKPHDQTK